MQAVFALLQLDERRQQDASEAACSEVTLSPPSHLAQTTFTAKQDYLGR